MTTSPSSSAQAARERIVAQLRGIRLDAAISAHLEPFYIFDDQQVIVETLAAEIRITVPSEIQLYQRAFGEMGRLAAYGPPAKALILAAIDSLG